MIRQEIERLIRKRHVTIAKKITEIEEYIKSLLEEAART
jgi:hypothetical protein